MTSAIQLELFSTTKTTRAERLDDEWSSGVLPDRDGINAFVIMIRGKDDPPPPKKAERHSDRDKTPHLTLRKQSVEWWREQLRALLGDGAPRTFNALCVTVAGLTADICGGETPEDALWSLAHERVVEFTSAAPILFRMAAR